MAAHRAIIQGESLVYRAPSGALRSITVTGTEGEYFIGKDATDPWNTAVYYFKPEWVTR